jgi:hypothetical protein
MNNNPYFASNYNNFDIYQTAKCGFGVKQPTFVGGIPFQGLKQNDKIPYIYSSLCSACNKGECKTQRYNINYVGPMTEFQKMNK